MSGYNLQRIEALAERTTRKREEYEATMRERDERIREAIQAGVTMYRIAKTTGLTESNIRLIRDKETS